MSAILDEALRAKVQLAGAAAENSDVLAALVRSHLDVRSDGVVKVLDRVGNIRVGRSPDYADMTLDELVAEIATAKPALFGKGSTVPNKASTTPPASTAPITEKVLREAREGKPDRPPNPFVKGPGFNVTHQVLMQARDPAMAARLKAEAGE